VSEICPRCGSETQRGRWLLWCVSTNKCKWFRLMTKKERERA
jgi:hypothetical protein